MAQPGVRRGWLRPPPGGWDRPGGGGVRVSACVSGGGATAAAAAPWAPLISPRLMADGVVPSSCWLGKWGTEVVP